MLMKNKAQPFVKENLCSMKKNLTKQEHYASEEIRTLSKLKVQHVS